MFAVPAALLPTFQPEAILSPIQTECYKARAQALRPRFPWSEALLPVWNASLIHRSANVPGKVAYYATIDNMMTNRLTRTSPEMFLSRFLLNAPDPIRTAWSVEVLGQILPTISFIENDDPNGWYRIYDNGPNSCMQGADEVRQYAHSKNNLALAYHKNEVGKITQRVIVNKKKMTYLRIYGNANIEFFVAALNKLGYSQSSETLKDEIIYTSWRGCYECDTPVLCGPYLDGGYPHLQLLNKEEGIISEMGDDIYYGEDFPYCGCDGDCDDE